MDPQWLKEHVRDIPDWPQPGVNFKDITPLLAAPDAFAATVDAVAAPYSGERIDKVLGIEARGFVFAAPVAYRHAAGFVPVRKPGKLPFTIESQEYELEFRDVIDSLFRQEDIDAALACDVPPLALGG